MKPGPSWTQRTHRDHRKGRCSLVLHPWPHWCLQSLCTSTCSPEGWKRTWPKWSWGTEEAPGPCHSDRKLAKSPLRHRNTSTPSQREGSRPHQDWRLQEKVRPPRFCPLAGWNPESLWSEEEDTTKIKSQAQHEAAGLSDHQFGQVKRGISLGSGGQHI